MTRLVRITAHQARRLHARRVRGTVLTFRFLQPDPRDQAHRWSMESLAATLRSLPHPLDAKSYEIWITSTEINLVLWTPHRDDARRLLRHWQDFNPAIQRQTLPHPFPSIRPGSWIRVAQLRPRRAAKHPIETRFGQQGFQTITSPIVHVLNNLPLLSDGSTLVIQTTWHQNRLPWRWSPLSHIDCKPGLGHDPEALEEKRLQRLNYYAEIRIAEIHARHPGPENYTRVVADAYQVYRRSHANRLALYRHAWWPRRRIHGFLAAMRRRSLTGYRAWWPRPRLALLELAALVHPPPRGALVGDLAISNVRPLEASGGTSLQAEALRRFLESVDAPSTGVSRKLKASDIRAHRRRGPAP